MYVGNRYNARTIWFWAGRNLIQVTALAGFVYVGYEWLHWRFLSIPFLPIASIGTAVAFYIGFKNSQSYERLYEGRRLWGSITNSCRSFGAQVIGVVGNPGIEVPPERIRAVQTELLYRQMAWMNALRVQLRKTPALHRKRREDLLHIDWVKHVHSGDGLADEADTDAVLAHFSCSPERRLLAGKSNIAAHLLVRQAETLTDLKRRGWIDEFEHNDLMRHVSAFYEHQGGCERLKSFPFPRQYAIFSGWFVKIFMALLPFGLIKEMGALGRGASWLVIPFTALIAWVFYTMEQVGDSSEDPFDGGGNDVPISTICRSTEVDLREMLNETDLPARLQPISDVLL
ncbi:MAG: bestrophin family ion channel [Armatimonadota bacterium]